MVELLEKFVEKMDAKLNVWYTKYLSTAGLINTNLQTLHFYSMAAFKIPKSIQYEITKKIKAPNILNAKKNC